MKLHRGLIAQQPRILSVRALTREDIASLRTNQRVQNRVKTFRDTHHRLARLVAAGLRNEEVLRITGFSIGRLNTLKADPAFQELVASYRDKVTDAFAQAQVEVHESANELMVRGLHHLHEHFNRADDEDKLVPMASLNKLLPDLMDRFGYSKKVVNTNVNVDFAKEFERAMARQGRANVIDGAATLPLPSSPQETQPQLPSSPEDTQPEVSVGIRRRW